MTRKIAAALAAAAALAWTGVAAAQVAPFSREGGLIYVDCKVDRVAQRCELDTGATQMWLPPRPEFRSYPVHQTGGVMGASGGTAPADYIQIGTLSFGGFTLGDVDALLADTPFGHGVIGLDAIARLGAATFDYRRDELRRAGPVEADLCPLPFRISARLITVPVRLAGRQSALAGWDTGASLTVADLGFVRAHPELFDYVRPMAAGTDATTKGVPVSLYRTKSLSICGRTLRNVAVAAIDMSGPKAAVPDFPDITLGSNVMSGLSWAFDFTSGRWSVS